MIHSSTALSAPAIAFAGEMYTHCIQYLLLKWFNMPSTLPAHEAELLRGDIQRVIRFLLDDVESCVPGLQDRLLREMRGLAELLAAPAPHERARPLVTFPH